MLLGTTTFNMMMTLETERCIFYHHGLFTQLMWVLFCCAMPFQQYVIKQVAFEQIKFNTEDYFTKHTNITTKLKLKVLQK